jgi:hypothetical protein
VLGIKIKVFLWVPSHLRPPCFAVLWLGLCKPFFFMRFFLVLEIEPRVSLEPHPQPTFLFGQQDSFRFLSIWDTKGRQKSGEDGGTCYFLFACCPWNVTEQDPSFCFQCSVSHLPRTHEEKLAKDPIFEV